MQSIQKLRLREGVMPLQESCTASEEDALWRHQSALPALALSCLWTGQGRRLTLGWQEQIDTWLHPSPFRNQLLGRQKWAAGTGR